MAVVKGKSVFARVFQPGQYDYYFINLGIDHETAKELSAQGLKVRKADGNKEFSGQKETDFGEYIVQFKEDVKPPVVGPDGKTPFTDLIGNGSVVNVQYKAAGWTFKGKTGVTGYLKAVQVLEHIPYVAPEGSEPVKKAPGPVALEF